MNKLVIVGVVGALGACTQDPTPVALHDLGDTTLELVALGQINVELKVKTDGRCPLIGEDIVATFDNQPMHVARGGYDEVSDGCYPIAFWINPRDIGGVLTYEQGSSSSELRISDKSARWSIGSTRLFANEFVIDQANSTVTWKDVTAITSAQLSPAVPFTIAGNVISYAKGTQLTDISAYAHPTPSRCEGPGSCQVDLAGERHFDPAAP